jgi:hypothetical protein
MVGSKLVGLSCVDPGASEAPEPGIYSRKAERIFIKLGAIRAKRRSAAKSLHNSLISPAVPAKPGWPFGGN